MAQCPNCRQPLPEPPESFCPSCGAVLGVGLPRGTPGGSIPWEEREQRGFLAAFVENTKEVLTGPTRFYQRMPVTGGIPSPLLYGLLAGYLGLVATALYNAGINTALGTSLGHFTGASDMQQAMHLLQGGAGLVIQVVLGPFQIVIGLFLVSAIYHVLLMLFGGARKGFEATFRVACYSQAASVLGVVPVCGGLASAVYVIVLNIIGLSEAHGIGRGLAAAAVLVPILLVCCCCAAGLTLMFGGLAGVLSQIHR